MADVRKQTRILGAFALGGLLGAGLALLLAPQSGKKTREMITRKASKARRQTEDLTEEVADTFKNVVSDMGGLLSDLLSSGKGISERAKRNLADALDDSQKSFEMYKKRLLGK